MSVDGSAATDDRREGLGQRLDRRGDPAGAVAEQEGVRGAVTM